MLGLVSIIQARGSNLKGSESQVKELFWKG